MKRVRGLFDGLRRFLTFMKKCLDLNRWFELICVFIAAVATFGMWVTNNDIARMTRESITISQNIAKQDLTRLQTELRPYLVIQVYPEPNKFGTKEYFKKDGNSQFYWEELHNKINLVLPFKIRNVGKVPAINIEAGYSSLSQSDVPIAIGQNSISPDDETSEMFRPLINISTIVSDNKIKQFDIVLRVTYKGSDEIDSRTYCSLLKLTIMKREDGVYYVIGNNFKFDYLNKVTQKQDLQPSVTSVAKKYSYMGIQFAELLTIYGLYLVFVIFCFQEINNKMRFAQDRFRSWCSSRKDDLKNLGINWEVNSWLEKDLIFHLYDFKIQIKKAKEKLEVHQAGYPEILKIESEKACNDYYNYIHECLKFKNDYKKNAVWLFLLISIFKLLDCFKESVFLIVLSYLVIMLLMIIVYLMLRGPKFNFINNPLRNKWSELSLEEKKMVEKLENLVKEI